MTSSHAEGGMKMKTCSFVDQVDLDGTALDAAPACVGMGDPTDFYIGSIMWLQSLLAAGERKRGSVLQRA